MEELSPLDQAFQLREKGEELFYQGQTTEAARRLREASGTFREIGSTEDAVTTLSLAGLAFALEGNNYAELCFENALRLARERQEFSAEATVWCDKAIVQRWHGHPQFAEQYLQRSLMLQGQIHEMAIDHSIVSPRITSEYARTLIDLEAPHQKIKELLEGALTDAQKKGDGRLESIALSHLGLLELRLSDDSTRAVTPLYGALGALQPHFRESIYQEAVIYGLLSKAHPNPEVAHMYQTIAEDLIMGQPEITQTILRREAMLL